MNIAPIEPNWILKPSNEYYWDILDVKKDTNSTIPPCINLRSSQILHFFSQHQTFLKNHPWVRHWNQKMISYSFRKVISFICPYWPSPQRYGQVYIKHAKFTTGVPVVSVTLITHDITWEYWYSFFFCCLSLFLILIYQQLTVKKKTELHPTFAKLLLVLWTSFHTLLRICFLCYYHLISKHVTDIMPNPG